jgi:hypothetical protein
MKYDPTKYETVKERKERFYKDNQDGRIIVENKTPYEFLMEYALFKVEIYKNKEDQEKKLPTATGFAMEIRDKTLSVSNMGKEYESVNYSSWTETCEESAIGRALDNVGYSGNKKCSKEEIMDAILINTFNSQEITSIIEIISKPSA